MPESSWTSRRLTWEVLIVLLTIYTAIEVPLVLVLQLPRTGALLATDVAITAAFLADLMLRVIWSRRSGAEASRRYLRSWFIIDLLAAFPFGLFVTGPFAALRMLRLLRLVKLIRVTVVAKSFRNYFTKRSTGHLQRSRPLDTAILRPRRRLKRCTQCSCRFSAQDSTALSLVRSQH